MMTSSRLRFGIMCRSYRFDAWEAHCIRQLCDVADAAAVIIDDGNEENTEKKKVVRSSRLRRLLQPETPWTLYQRWFVNPRSSAKRKVDLTQLLGHLPRLVCRTQLRGKFSRYFQADDLQRVAGLQLDFVLRCAFDILRGPILSVPKFGVWSFHHDDLDSYRGGPPCFWEIYHDDPISGAVLQRLTDRLDGGIVLKRGYFKTNRTSYRGNRDHVYWASADWPRQVVRDLESGNAQYLEQPPTSTAAPIHYRPSLRQLLWFACKTSWNRVKAAVRPAFKSDQWNVGVLDSPPSVFVTSQPTPEIKWLPPRPRSQFIADPIPAAGQADAVLVEGFDYRSGRGTISILQTSGNQICSEQTILNGDFHYSYPFSFEENGCQYCLPERSETGELTLFKRCDDHKWRSVSTLIEAPVLDPTLWQHEGIWWLFGTLVGPYANTQLHIWHADNVRGPWVPHQLNPVKCDVRSSRPAGPLFEHEGHWYRPAQDCSRTYGGAVTINRLGILTTKSFREVAVTSIKPDANGPYPHGLHTVSAADGKTLIDGKREVFIPSASLAYVRRKFGRLFWRTPTKDTETVAT